MTETTGSTGQDRKNERTRLQLLECYLYKLRFTSCAFESATLLSILGFWQEWESLKEQPIEQMIESLPILFGCVATGTIAKVVAGINENTHKEVKEEFNEMKRNKTRTK